MAFFVFYCFSMHATLYWTFLFIWIEKKKVKLMRIWIESHNFQPSLSSPFVVVVVSNKLTRSQAHCTNTGFDFWMMSISYDLSDDLFGPREPGQMCCCCCYCTFPHTPISIDLFYLCHCCGWFDPLTYNRFILHGYLGGKIRNFSYSVKSCSFYSRINVTTREKKTVKLNTNSCRGKHDSMFVFDVLALHRQ